MVTQTYLLLAVGSLLLGLAAGAVLHRSHFCLAGMFRDLFLFRRFDKLRSLLLYVAVTLLLFEGARRLLTRFVMPASAPAARGASRP